MTDDLTRAETAAMDQLEGGRWTRTTRIPPAALESLVARGLAEVSTWAEWTKLTGAGDEMFRVSA